MAFNFAGKRILVTGAGQGIGRALAIGLHSKGCKVFAVSRTDTTLVTLKQECPDITTLKLDISDLDEMEAQYGALGVMDGVVNNAADFHNTPPLLGQKSDFDAVMTTNVWAQIRTTQIFAKKMISANVKGSIVNVSSVLSLEARDGSFLYCISKAALDMVTKQFSLDLAAHAIRVNSINPSLVITDTNRSMIEDGSVDTTEFMRRTGRGRFLDFGEVVSPIMYLLSDHSSGVTGTQHVVDAGLLSTLRAKQK